MDIRHREGRLRNPMSGATRASICQIGLACVWPDGGIETWSSFVDPGTHDWFCSFVHGITGRDVRGAPRFAEVFDRIDRVLAGRTVYQHGGFDRGAIEAACRTHGLVAPAWDLQDSVQVARRAWPELTGDGGHGLASLKTRLGLDFRHHDAGEDARAAAEIVLLAETGVRPDPTRAVSMEDDVIEPFDAAGPVAIAAAPPSPTVARQSVSPGDGLGRIGMVPVAADGRASIAVWRAGASSRSGRRMPRSATAPSRRRSPRSAGWTLHGGAAPTPPATGASSPGAGGSRSSDKVGKLKRDLQLDLAAAGSVSWLRSKARRTRSLQSAPSVRPTEVRSVSAP